MTALTSSRNLGSGINHLYLPIDFDISDQQSISLESIFGTTPGSEGTLLNYYDGSMSVYDENPIIQMIDGAVINDYNDLPIALTINVGQNQAFYDQSSGNWIDSAANIVAYSGQTYMSYAEMSAIGRLLFQYLYGSDNNYAVPPNMIY